MADPANPLDLSDEDFAKFNSPEQVSGTADAPAAVVEAPVAPAAAEVVEPAPVVETPTEPAPAVEAPKTPDINDVEDKDFPAVPPVPAAPDAAPVAPVVPEGEAKAEPKANDKPAAPAVDAPKAEAVQEPLNYAQIGELIMKPFKANGKMIEVKTPEEAVKLMQMGANYTRRMQDIQPHRKMLTMLENNGLLDEDRISFLIDLDKKDPAAIQKLIKDSGIDPLEIDTAVEPAYQGGSHKVTDAEMNFHTAVEELVAQDGGKESVEVFNTTWDQTTKEKVFAEPGLLKTMHDQKQNGIYDRISAEIERQRTLGALPISTPFIVAYQSVGLDLHNAGAFNDLAPKVVPPASAEPSSPIVSAETTAAPQPVATRAAAPDPVVDNNDKVSAASPTNTAARPAKPVVDIFAMSDDQFMASMQGRV